MSLEGLLYLSIKGNKIILDQEALKNIKMLKNNILTQLKMIYANFEDFSYYLDT